MDITLHISPEVLLGHGRPTLTDVVRSRLGHFGPMSLVVDPFLPPGDIEVRIGGLTQARVSGVGDVAPSLAVGRTLAPQPDE